jgi:hypothetical protein
MSAFGRAWAQRRRRPTSCSCSPYNVRLTTSRNPLRTRPSHDRHVPERTRTHLLSGAINSANARSRSPRTSAGREPPPRRAAPPALAHRPARPRPRAYMAPMPAAYDPQPLTGAARATRAALPRSRSSTAPAGPAFALLLGVLCAVFPPASAMRVPLERRDTPGHTSATTIWVRLRVLVPRAEPQLTRARHTGPHRRRYPRPPHRRRPRLCLPCRPGHTHGYGRHARARGHRDSTCGRYRGAQCPLPASAAPYATHTEPDLHALAARVQQRGGRGGARRLSVRVFLPFDNKICADRATERRRARTS